MSATRRVAGAAMLAVGALALGCAPYAPSGWLPTPEVARTEAYGGWMRVETRQGQRRAVSEGELIAITQDSVFLLGASGFVAIPTASVTTSALEMYNPRTGALSATVLLGTASTISNGALLLISAPAWLIVGPLAVNGALQAARVKASLQSPTGWEAYRVHARFPAGLPPGLDRSALRPKKTIRRRDPGLW